MFRIQTLEARHPELQGKPFAMALQAEGAMAVIDSLSPSARRLRIPPGIRIGDFKVRWPNIPILAPDFLFETELRARILSFSDQQTPTHHWVRDSIFLDLSGMARIHGSDWADWAKRFTESIVTQFGLRSRRVALSSISSTAELLAIGSRGSDPVFCPKGQEREHLAKIPLRFLTWLEPRIHSRLHLYNLSTLGDLQRLDRRFLLQHFGAEGESLYAMAQGMNIPDKQKQESDSVSVQTHLVRDLALDTQIQAELHQLCDQLSFMLRSQNSEARELQVLLQYADGQECQASQRFPSPTTSFPQIKDSASEMLAQIHKRRIAVRCITLSSSRPQSGNAQIDLFPEAGVKSSALAHSLDKVRRKLGFNAVVNGNVVPTIAKAVLQSSPPQRKRHPARQAG